MGKPHRGTTRKGGTRLRIRSNEAALGAIWTKGCDLSARYRRIVRHRGDTIAGVAVASTLLEIASQLLTRETTYQKLVPDSFCQRDKE